MNYQDNPLDKYRAAYDEAALELRNISLEFEQLCQRRDRIAKVIEVLKPAAAADGQHSTAKFSLTTKSAGVTIVTRLNIFEKNFGVQE